MIQIKNAKELDGMRRANALSAAALKYGGEHIEAGMTTWELDKLIYDFIVKHGGIPNFKGLYGFPGTACISLNDTVIHGIPSHDIVIRPGDIVSIDTGAKVDGFNGDNACTYAVGKVDLEAQRLLEVTKASLYKGIEQAVAGNRIGDIGYAQSNRERYEGFCQALTDAGKKVESSLCLIFLISFSTLPVIGLVLIYGGITLVNLFQLILNLVITGIFIGSIGIFYSAIMRKTTVAVILSYVTVVLLVLGTVGILFGIGYIQQMQGMYQEDFTGIRLGGLVYLLYFNPAVTLYGLIGQQTTNAYGLVRLCGYFGDYSHSFGVEHMVELSILVQLGCSVLLLIAAGRHINPMRK